MTEPSKQATSLANQFYDGGYFGSSHDDVLWASHLIDAALTEARKEGHAEGYNHAVSRMGLAQHHKRRDLTAMVERLTRERDELAATVERVIAEVETWTPYESRDCGEVFPSESVTDLVADLRDALNGGESDE